MATPYTLFHSINKLMLPGMRPHFISSAVCLGSFGSQSLGMLGTAFAAYAPSAGETADVQMRPMACQVMMKSDTSLQCYNLLLP